LRRKVKAGADFALTQPVFDVELAAAFIARYQTRYGRLQIPILAGVLPLYNERHVAFLHNEVPGIQIPDAIRGAIVSAGERSAEVGVEIAVELLQGLSGVVQGAYIMPAFNRYDLAAEVIESLRSTTAGS